MRPIGFWSTCTSRSTASSPVASTVRAGGSSSGPAASPVSSSSAEAASGRWVPRCRATTSASTWLTRVDLPEPETPVTAVRTPSGTSTSRSADVVPGHAGQPQPAGGLPSGRRAGRLLRVCREEEAPGRRLRHRAQRLHRAAVQDPAAGAARSRADVDDPVGASYDVHVVLDDEQGVAGRLEAVQDGDAAARRRRGAGRRTARRARRPRRTVPSAARSPGAAAGARRRTASASSGSWRGSPGRARAAPRSARPGRR